MVMSTDVQLIQTTDPAVNPGAVIVTLRKDIILRTGIVITAIQVDLNAPFPQDKDHVDNLTLTIVPRYQAELKP